MPAASTTMIRIFRAAFVRSARSDASARRAGRAEGRGAARSLVRRFWRRVSVAMARGDLGVDFIFVYDRDRVNSQIGIPSVPDHHLARLPDAVMSHVVPGLSPRKSPAVYVDPLPFHSRIISDKDEVRNSPLFRAVNTQVGPLSITKEFAFAIFQRKLTAGTDHRCLPIRRSQCVQRIRDAGGLVRD